MALGDGGRILVTADVEAGGRAALLLGLSPLEASDDVDATLPDAISLASVPIAAVEVRARARAHMCGRAAPPHLLRVLSPRGNAAEAQQAAQTLFFVCTLFRPCSNPVQTLFHSRVDRPGGRILRTRTSRPWCRRRRRRADRPACSGGAWLHRGWQRPRAWASVQLRVCLSSCAGCIACQHAARSILTAE